MAVKTLTLQEAELKANIIKESIRKWDHEYYVKNKPSVPDAAYDTFMVSLRQIEQTYPSLVTEDSPTQRVADGLIATRAKIKHVRRMISIRTAVDYTLTAVVQFCDKIQKLLPGQRVKYIAELKYDGLGVSLNYVDGLLKYAVTRGDGDTGDDVTVAVSRIKEIPRRLAKPLTCEIRGEVYMRKSKFAEINKLVLSLGEEPYVNPRNAASGLLTSRDSSLISKTNALSFFAYQAFFEKQPATQGKVLDYLDKLGMPVQLPLLFDTAVELNNFHDIMHAERPNMDYDFDGIVYKVNDFKQCEQLGYNSREPVWALAHKYPAEDAVTTLEAIEIQIGRTGVITPVGRLKPVFVGGATVSNVTLHNQDEIDRKGLYEGADVLLQRAGDVIPKITQVINPTKPPFKIIEHFPFCPCCHTPLVQEGTFVYCRNKDCDEQIVQALTHACGRNALNIAGLGPANIKVLVNKVGIKSLVELFLIDTEDFVNAGLTEYMAKKLYDAIQLKRHQPLNRFIYALGIDNVGESTAKALAGKFLTWEGFIGCTEAELIEMDDVGEITAASIMDYFKDWERGRAASNAADCITFTEPKLWEVNKPVNDILGGKLFAITGSFEGQSREGLAELVIKNGGIYTKSINAKTNYILVGDAPGKVKVDAAKKHNVEEISLVDFHTLLKGKTL